MAVVPPAAEGAIEPLSSPWVVEPVILPVDIYRSGLLPEAVRNMSRERRRAAGISQEEVARHIGISRPQLANVEAGRFGLSAEAAARFLAVMAALPVRQPTLL